MKKQIIVILLICMLCMVFNANAYSPVPETNIEVIPKEVANKPHTRIWTGNEFIKSNSDGYSSVSKDGIHYNDISVKMNKRPIYGNGLNAYVYTYTYGDYPPTYKGIINNSPALIFDENWNLVKEVAFDGQMREILFYDGYFHFYYMIMNGNERIGTYYKTKDWEDWEKDDKPEYMLFDDGKGNYWKPNPSNSPIIYNLTTKGYEYVGYDKTYPLTFEKNITIPNPSFYENTVLWTKLEDNRYLFSTDCIYWYEAPFSEEYTWIYDGYLYKDTEECYYRIPLSSFKAPYVVLNDQLLAFETPPVIEDDRTLVPMRFLFEQMGADVTWDNATRTATAKKNATEISFSIDKTSASVDGKVNTMDVPARLINGKTMVPLRFLSENLGYNVEWDGEHNLAVIKN